MAQLTRARMWISACILALAGSLIAVPQALAADDVIPCSSKPFDDVGRTSTFCLDVEWLSAQGITTGYEDGTYNPSGSVTRGEMSAFLYRLANPNRSDPACVGSTPAADVAITNPFCGTITWLKSKGITQVGNAFNPSGSVGRGAMSAFLYRIANPGKSDPTCSSKPFSDVPARSTFCGTISWLSGAGITTGTADGTFAPNAPVTREAMAAFLHRTADSMLKSVTLGPGSYTVGTAVAAGRYLVTPGAGQSGKFQVARGDTLVVSEAIGGSGVPSVTTMLNVGDKITVTGVGSMTFSPASVRLRISLTTGNWLVGRDIAAGRYDATPGKGQAGTFAVNGASCALSSGTTNSGFASCGTKFWGSVTVTLKAGDEVVIEGMATVRFAAA